MNVRNCACNIGTRLEDSLIILVTESLACGALGRNVSLIAIEDWNIDRHIEASCMHVSGIARLHEGDRHFWKLSEDGGTNCCVLAFQPLPQSKKIETPRFNIVQQIVLIRWCQTARQNETS